MQDFESRFTPIKRIQVCIIELTDGDDDDVDTMVRVDAARHKAEGRECATGLAGLAGC